MRRSARNRNRQRGQGGGVSLFPFLAVLVCTMGSLIILLVVIARQAQLQAAETADADVAELEAEIETQRERTQWRTEAIRGSLLATRQQLAEARNDLGHLEDHARRLGEQLAELRAAYAQLDQGDDALRKDELRRELDRAETQLAEARRRLAEAQQAAAQRPATYAVVPYRGPHETQRRPIYIECRAEAIVLQPEGIVLEDEDFLGPIGPDNPLAAALRAAREHQQRIVGFDPSRTGEPYPLLLIRPQGIVAYSVARKAISSWATDFGYELIGEDWRLEYPPADPDLAQAMQFAVDAARVRQQQAAAVASSRAGRSEPTWYTVAPNRGGTVAADGSGRRPASSPARNANDNINGSGGPERRLAQGNVAETRSGTTSAASDATDGFSSSGGMTDQRPGQAEQGSTPRGQSGQGQSGQTQTERAQSGGYENPIRQPGGEGASGERALGEPHFGQWSPGGGAAGESSSSAPADAKRPESLAQQRGRDWGLPDATRGAVPISRPIRIECHRDRLVLVPEGDAGRGRTISLRPRTEDSVDELVSAVWEHVASWGVAGNNMYWRPILRVNVAADAARRYDDLDALLEGSGLRIERP